MSEVASAYVSLLPSAKGWGKQVDQQITPELDKAGKSGGSRLSSALGGVLKKSALGIGVAAGGILGTALFKGFQRLSAIDEAKAKLTGLGNSTKTVDTIMTNALASVKGTAFGLGDAATVAAGAVASGIKPGKDLTASLKLVADAATIAGVPLNEMGAIFNKVAASGKLQGDVIAQLGDKGIPILQLLGKQLGKTPAEVAKLASQGKIDFATFSAAMQSGLGGAALKSGNTFSGALANVGASLGRIGAGLLGGIFPHLAPAFQGITKALEPLEGKATSVGDAIGKVLGPALENIGPFITKAITAISSFDISGFFSSLSGGKGTLGSIGEAFRSLGSAIGTIDFGALASGLGKGLADTVSVFSIVIGFAADHVDLLAKALPALVVAFAAYKTAQAASNVLALVHVPLQTAMVAGNFALASSNRALAAQMAISNGVEKTSMLTRARATVATVASTAAQLVASAASKTMTAAQWLLNAALTANPIGLVIVGLVALGAAFYLLWTKSTTFRTIVTGAFHAVQAAVSFVVDFIKAHWPLLLAILTGPVGIAVLLIVKNFDKIKAAGTSVVNWVKAIPGKLAALASKFGSAGKTLIQAFINGLSKAGSIATNFATSIWNAVKGAINHGIDKLNGLLEFSVKVGPKKFTVNAPNIGHLAKGTDNWRGGPSWVGENGPEILNIPRGSQVIPNHKVGDAMGRSGAAVEMNVYPQPGQSESEIGRAAANRLLWAMA